MYGWLRVLLVLASLAVAVSARGLEIETARVTWERDGVTFSREAGLPYHWDLEHANRSGVAELEMQFRFDADANALYGIYFARIGNRAEVWLNGRLLSRLGVLGAASQDDYVKAPRLFLVPGELFQGDNVLRVVIETDGSRRGGLSRPQIGPAEEMRQTYQQDYFWRVDVSLIIAVFSLTVGVIALLLWLTQQGPALGRDRTRDGLYLAAGFAELFWVLRLLDGALEQPPLPWGWWFALQNVALAGWACGVAMFCQHVAGWQRHASMRWIRGAVIVMMVTAGPVAWAAEYWQRKGYLTVWLGVLMIMFIGYLFYYAYSTFRDWSVDKGLVVFAGAANVAVGVRDWVVVRLYYEFGAVPWQKYSSILFGIALLYVLVMRFHRSQMQARDLMDNMAAKVRERERELATSYQRLEQLAREQERAAERTRILRDMHDGVGSHISAAIRQLQSGKASQDELLATLRESLDQLKLSIDSMNLPPGDVTTLLANLRYRLEPRLKASDIELVWDVDLLDPLPGLDGKAMRQLQFMVFEALSNVLQHAQASELRIELKAGAAGGARLRVVDNGRGFDAQGGSRKGLVSLRERAQALGARLTVESQPGHTVVQIDIGPA